LLLIPLMLIFGTVLGIGWYVLSAVNVTLSLDGQLIKARTHQPTVAGFLKEAGVWLESADTVAPERTDPIRDGLTISVHYARAVVIDTDRSTPRRFLTNADHIPAILAEAGITPQAHDVIQSLPGATGTPTDIVIRAPLLVTLVDGSQSRPLYTAAATVSGALLEAGVTLFVADTVTPDLNALITADISTITIHRSQPVTINVDTRTLATRTHGITVGAVLAESRIALVGLDRAEPAVDQPFVPGMTIIVERVTESDEVQQITLPFKTIQQVDTTLPGGTKRVIQAGVAGLQEIHIRVRRENGVEVSRSAPLSWQIQPPQDQIVAVAGDVPIVTATPTTP
jgi:uncharacterized protein YabE (DUF348 family)